MVKLDKDEYEALRVLSFVTFRRRPASVDKAAAFAKGSPENMAALFQRLIAKRLARKVDEGYLVTARGERAIEDNFVPDPTSIGANRQWLDANTAAWWGRFVALRNNELIAEGKDGRELRARLRSMEPHERVLIVPLIEMGSTVVKSPEELAKESDAIGQSRPRPSDGPPFASPWRKPLRARHGRSPSSRYRPRFGDPHSPSTTGVQP